MTPLLTFFYRHLPQLITAGCLYIAVPPLYRVDIGKETYWTADEDDRIRILDEHGNGRSTPRITRFEGLSEMMPKTLRETTLDPATRRLLRVDVSDSLLTDRVMSDLMGKVLSARFRFIMERAKEAVRPRRFESTVQLGRLAPGQNRDSRTRTGCLLAIAAIAAELSQASLACSAIHWRLTVRQSSSVRPRRQ